MLSGMQVYLVCVGHASVLIACTHERPTEARGLAQQQSEWFQGINMCGGRCPQGRPEAPLRPTSTSDTSARRGAIPQKKFKLILTVVAYPHRPSPEGRTLYCLQFSSSKNASIDLFWVRGLFGIFTERRMSYSLALLVLSPEISSKIRQRDLRTCP